MRPVLLTAVLLLIPAAAAPAAETAPLTPAEVLRAGPVVVRPPAFHDAERAGVELADLLDEQPAVPGDGWPAAGESAAGPGQGRIVWRPTREAPFPVVSGANTVTWTAFYVESDRWQEARLTVVAPREVRATLDGAALELAAGEGDTLTADLELEIGKHLVVLRTLNAWLSDVSVTPADHAGPQSLELSVDPSRTTDIRLVLHAPRPTGLALSPDGRLVAIAAAAYRDGEHRETRLEIRATDDGRLVHVWRGGEPDGLRWLATGNRLSWATTTDERTTIWRHDLDTGELVAVLEDVADLGDWRWAPDGSFLVHEITREPEPDPRDVKRVVDPADRQPHGRRRAHLVQVFVPGGYARRLTAGPISPRNWRISPDGGSLLFFLSAPDLARRPYHGSELWLLDLATLEASRLLDEPWIGAAEWSPAGDALLLRGSPSAFDGLGLNLPEGVQPNDYGGQLYLWDLGAREARPLTRTFAPDVRWARWCRADGRIYALATDRQEVNVYRAEPGEDWERVETGFGVTDELALPRDGRTAVAYGTGATAPPRVHRIDLRSGRAEPLHDPGADAWRDVRFGQVERWVAELPDGGRLDGRVHYPPDFDPARTYPVIVYYYGGTSPVTVDFGGRYPKNVWAAQGYVVYVPQPSGATGYGQEMAARHVNDWGERTAAEVVAGTEAFLAAHPFADPERVGCIGASYGGFLTLNVITKTDLFAAAVSHAGISSISSYWGEGLWGYLYGARALAGAFPWQDRDLYVDNSALFRADRITTPLLLVHGAEDTNVPVGESDQIFTALKLLGREVEYVQILGQDHWILDHDQRIVWNDTILAFFARHLKGRPQWWDALHPEPEDWR